MDNFFSNALDYNVFKKALKITDGESVVITVSSTDPSLTAPVKYNYNPSNNRARKNMSSKYEPSPFGRFFGSSKRNSAPVDMNDFTSWKNKNYREAEEGLNKTQEDTINTFSISNFMKENSGDKYNELDQAKSDLQKPIEQLSSDDPTLKKFSLDSYMHKLEESILAKDKFEKNDDLLEPIVSDENEDKDQSKYQLKQLVDGLNSFQDEDFPIVDTNIESFAMDSETSGNDFSLNQEELEKVKKKIARIEKKAQNIKEKSNQKLLVDDDFFNDDEDESEKKEEEPVDKTSLDSIILKKDDDNSNIVEIVDEKDIPEKTEKSSYGKKLNEVVLNSDAKKSPTPNKSGSQIVKQPIFITSAPVDEKETEKKDQTVAEKKPDENSDSGVLTKAEFKDMTNDFMSKFSELYKMTTGKGDKNQPQEYYPEDGAYASQDAPYQEMIYNPNGQYTPYDYQSMADFQNNQQELQAKILELVEDKNKTDKENQERLKKIEEERNKIDEEYKNKLKEMEENYSKKYEEFKQKMYLDKVNNDKAIKEKEDKIKIRDKEIKAENKNRDMSIVLKKEIKSNFNIANLEMEKKLLEVSAKLNKEENQKLKENLSKRTVIKVPVPVPVSVPEPAPAPKPEPEVKKPAPKRRKKNKSRKIDSDIIGNIDF